MNLVLMAIGPMTAILRNVDAALAIGGLANAREATTEGHVRRSAWTAVKSIEASEASHPDTKALAG